MFYDYLCKGKSLYLSTQCLLITISFPDMDIVDKLNKEFLTQPFCKNEQLPEELNEYKRIAYNYARIENSIAVLSDMHTNISYIYYGGTAETLGILGGKVCTGTSFLPFSETDSTQKTCRLLSYE